jgi:hypothetical protein
LGLLEVFFFALADTIGGGPLLFLLLMTLADTIGGGSLLFVLSMTLDAISGIIRCFGTFAL